MAILVTLLWLSIISFIVFLISGYLAQMSKNGKAKRWYLISIGSFVTIGIITLILSTM